MNGELRRLLELLDEPHLRYARAYADELALGDPAPSSDGLNQQLVRKIRRAVWDEWRRRIDSMGGKRR